MEYHLPGLTRRGSSPTTTSLTPSRRRPWTTNNSIEATCLMKKNLPAAFQNLRRPSSRILKNLPTQPASIYYHHQRSEDCWHRQHWRPAEASLHTSTGPAVAGFPSSGRGSTTTTPPKFIAETSRGRGLPNTEDSEEPPNSSLNNFRSGLQQTSRVWTTISLKSIIHNSLAAAWRNTPFKIPQEA